MSDYGEQRRGISSTKVIKLGVFRQQIVLSFARFVQNEAFFTKSATGRDLKLFSAGLLFSSLFCHTSTWSVVRGYRQGYMLLFFVDGDGLIL